MFGIRLTRNFAYPYFSQNLREFWSRWHISLSTWFRDYVYLPLGGNRVSRWRHKANLLVTFLLSGFWHGAAWPFAIWGGLHGTAVAFGSSDRQPKEKRQLQDVAGGSFFPAPLLLFRMLKTFAFVCVCWIFFRAESWGDCLTILQTLSHSIVSSGFYQHLADLFELDEIRQAFALIALLVGLEWIQRKREHPLEFSKLPEPLQWSTISMVAWFVIECAGRVTDNPFLYFQF